MARKIPTIRIAKIILFAVLAIIALRFVCKPFLSEHGTVSNVSVLQKVFQRGGPEIAATFTNSLIQRFPFDGNVDWVLQHFKMPQVVLSGKVDTNALHQFVRDHPSTRFIWSVVDKSGQNWIAEEWPTAEEYARIARGSVWFKVLPDGGGYAAVIEGEVEFPSRVGTVRSWSPDWVPPEKK